MWRFAGVLIGFTFIVSVCFVIEGCNTNSGNSKPIVSQDVNELSRVIDLSVYHPSKVEFVLTKMDNSGGRVPGPSDEYLDAVLFYTDTLIRKLSGAISTTCDSVKLADYQFRWLEGETLKQVKEESSMQCLHQATPYKSSPFNNGWCIVLTDKVLVHLNTQ